MTRHLIKLVSNYTWLAFDGETQIWCPANDSSNHLQTKVLFLIIICLMFDYPSIYFCHSSNKNCDPNHPSIQPSKHPKTISAICWSKPAHVHMSSSQLVPHQSWWIPWVALGPTIWRCTWVATMVIRNGKVMGNHWLKVKLMNHLWQMDH